VSGYNPSGLYKEIEVEEFPWTFDQFQRYAVLGSLIDVFFKGKAPGLLDVGGVAPTRDGKAYWFPALRISPENTKIVDLAPCTGENFIRGDTRALPLSDGLFDLVSALDILEHISKEGRTQAISEFSRVTRDMVFLSSPFKDDAIERTEDLLFSQIQELFGIEHVQLKQHKTYGLPEVEEVSRELETKGFEGMGFSYGSLENFLFFQSLKNCLMFKEKWERMHACIDRFMCRLSSPLDFSGPFSRHFWVYSKIRSREELEEGLGELKETLQSRDHGISLLSLLKDFNRDLIRVFYPESVSALVVTTENGKKLENCLRHLLTQEVQFDLEVCVWDIKNSQEIQRKVESTFPGVKYLGIEGEKTAREGILEAAFLLKGGYVLFLDENVLLPKDSVRSFLKNSKERGGDALITPQILVQSSQAVPETQEKNEKVMFWVKRPKKKKLEKNYPYAEPYDSRRSCWVWSPWLFIPRSMLLKREEDKKSLSKENIFLWGNDKDPMRIVFLDDFMVYYVRQR
jgi:hypothetical protein